MSSGQQLYWIGLGDDWVNIRADRVISLPTSDGKSFEVFTMDKGARRLQFVASVSKQIPQYQTRDKRMRRRASRKPALHQGRRLL